MRPRKPQRGCCGVCGCAVVAPDAHAKWAAVGDMNGRVHGERRMPGDGWASGHEFDEAGNLLCVRCSKHVGWGFPPVPVNSDATVLM